ncbi:acyltransferase [Pedobacter sp.]|jgi:peptidoglycan/LPS O-acetylase OafA/YrhL|uniref:acyltransferase family protein n=1 Tax=Pedobacter sp. TaxID=1411316 RepID=UPI002B6BE2B7|nr:acyltransferase [Pedobacter sp.]HWW41773.1 acyltransferase [Pedobacter sp.]
MANKNKITSLAALRGIAVIAVCFCHFSKAAENGAYFSGVFKWMEDYGKYGLQVFFVISGFVIPYSLEKSGYAFLDYPRFLYKRLLRLHPPYLAALAFTLFIAEVSYRSRHLPNPENLSTILQSLFYLHAPIDNPVFWSLRIEAEYYLFIGLYFILLKKYPFVAVGAGIPILTILSQTHLVDYCGLFNFMVFFMIGTVGFLVYNKSSRPWLEQALLVFLLVFCFLFYEQGAAIAALFTISVILYVNKNFHSVLEHPGEISYSLYLIHFPLGIKFMNLMMRTTNGAYVWWLFVGAFFLSYACAWIFWRLIERPCMKLSQKIKYTATRTAAVPLPVQSL